MSKIRVLPEHIANKIAAGEVVDRPASVVKELVENALDAAADRITVVIGKSGKELIQVIDNGSGMNETDVPIAFQRHATSKISDAGDLDELTTLGFRGEALPSIASVSRVEIKTCLPDEQVGTRLQINGGKPAPQEKIAFKPGTTFSVKSLFYNTPARRNFLRSDTTEFNHILRTLKRFFLCYPGVQFTLIHNGEVLYELPRAEIDDRITAVFGEKFYDGLIYVRETIGDTVLDGYVCRPDQARGGTENQFIFLNRRPIINRSLSHAIFQGYGNLMERSRYPQFIMFLELPPRLVDVNVHPTKMEVRFANEQAIYHLFLSAVRRGVQTRDGAPMFDIASGEAVERRREIREQLGNLPRMDFSSGAAAGKTLRSFTDRPGEGESQINFEYAPLPPRPDEVQQKGATSDDNSAENVPSRLWQVHQRYIFSSIRSGLVIIDQHAAHARILFEKIQRILQKEEKQSAQQLLFPQTVELGLEDFLIYEGIREWLSKMGFVINGLSGRTIVIEAIPSDVKAGEEARVLLEIVDYYREHKGEHKDPGEQIAAAFAAKNAIRPGDKLTPAEMHALVDRLFTTRKPYFSPSGNPVMVTVELDEIERRFKK